MDADRALLKISAARAAIAQAKSVDEVKSIRDKAEAIRAYSKQAGMSQDIVNDAAEIKIRAEYKAGQLLKEMEKNKGAVAGGKKDGPRGHIVLPRDTSPTLSALGVSKNESSRWQMLATIPEEEFEAKLQNERAAVRELTTHGMLKAARQTAKQAKVEAMVLRNENIDHGGSIFVCADFRTYADENIPDESVDLIFTDPPYPEEYLPLWSDIALTARRVLKPGGLCLAYSGQIFLPDTMRALSEHLDYFWTFAVVHRGGGQRIFKSNVNCWWKPILAFVKPPAHVWWDGFNDTVNGAGREKDSHAWQQALNEAEYFVSRLCPRGGVVFDPCAGSGTTLIAAKKSGMHYIGTEIDRAHFIVAQERLKNG